MPSLQEKNVYCVRGKQLIWINKYIPHGRSNIRVENIGNTVTSVQNPYFHDLEKLLNTAEVIGKTTEQDPNLKHLFPEYFI